MCNFFLEKVTPVVLGLFGISCINMPHNYVRTALHVILDTVDQYFTPIFQSLL